MKIDTIMVDNRPLSVNTDIFYNYTVAANVQACNKFNYNLFFYKPYSKILAEESTYMCKDPNTGEKRHVAWAKIIATLNHLKKNDCDYVIYIDTDAFLLNQIYILDYLNNINCDKDIFFCNNLPWDRYQHRPCSGFFVIKKTDYVFTFLEDWYKQKGLKFNTKHGWEQPVLHQTYKNYDLFVDPEPTTHFVTEMHNSDYSQIVHHITKFLVKDSSKYLSVIKDDISKYYTLLNLERDFEVNMLKQQPFNVDCYSTLEAWPDTIKH